MVAFKQSFVTQTRENYDILDKEINEDENLAELDGLDDFLLMDQNEKL